MATYSGITVGNTTSGNWNIVASGSSGLSGPIHNDYSPKVARPLNKTTEEYFKAAEDELAIAETCDDYGEETKRDYHQSRALALSNLALASMNMDQMT